MNEIRNSSSLSIKEGREQRRPHTCSFSSVQGQRLAASRSKKCSAASQLTDDYRLGLEDPAAPGTVEL